MFSENTRRDPVDARMFKTVIDRLKAVQAADAEPVEVLVDEDSIQVAELTKLFAGADRDLLEEIATAWFDHSGLFPVLAVCNRVNQTVTFVKSLITDDPVEAIRNARDGMEQALTRVDLHGVDTFNGFGAEVAPLSKIRGFAGFGVGADQA
ncbi:hypothetical protein SAMN05216215_101877 [Saccharopolyspora shandongensis]|uniref:Uncharacterized protein n=1 Tax=Saccharopolyspora shandongensis TaxID=418495 RepID=A0A1H3G867_9PSEU|nr:hypothetical protein SAMN05216215_101877 [Saccharopolyspora shandongensis]